MKAKSAETNYQPPNHTGAARAIRRGLDTGLAVVTLGRVTDPDLRARIKAEAKRQADELTINATMEDLG
jgi:hypothetical protein